MDTATQLQGQFDTYTLGGSLGRRNNHGALHAATCRHSGQRVTVKRLEHHHEGLPQLFERLSQISHPALAHCRDWFTGPDGSFYVVKEYVEGTDLKSIFTNKKIYGHINENQYLRLGCSILSGLSVLHDMGIVHRDIKPSNIILRHNSSVSPTECDFSDVVLTDYERADTYPTPSCSRSAFSLIYSPPEMVLKRSSLIGPPTDLYALSLTLYHLIMGKSPFTDCNPEVLITLQMTYPMKKPGRMTDELYAVLSKAAAKASFRLPPRRLSVEEVDSTLRDGIAARYGKADEMLAELKNVEKALLPQKWWQKTLGI